MKVPPFALILLSAQVYAAAQGPFGLKLEKEPAAADIGSAGIVVYIVTEEGQVRVLLRKVANEFAGYKWSFAKGRLDGGEAPRDAAYREVNEEMGVAPDIEGWLVDDKGLGLLTRYYVGSISLNEVDLSFSSSETERVAVVSVSEARGLLNMPRDQRVLAALEVKLRSSPHCPGTLGR